MVFNTMDLTLGKLFLKTTRIVCTLNPNITMLIQISADLAFPQNHKKLLVIKSSFTWSGGGDKEEGDLGGNK